MLLDQINIDSSIIASAVVVLGIFTYTFYNNIFNTIHNSSNTNNKLDSLSELPETSSPCIDSLQNRLPIEEAVQTSDNSLWSLFKDWLWEKNAGLSNFLFRTPTDIRDDESESGFPELVEVEPSGIYDIEIEKELYDLIKSPGTEFHIHLVDDLWEPIWEYTLTLADNIVLSVAPKAVDFLIMVDPTIFFIT
jgi:hypothetical protein